MQSQSICSDLLGVTYANSNIPSAQVLLHFCVSGCILCVHIQALCDVFPWGAAPRLRTARRSGSGTKQAQQTSVSDAGEGSPVETLTMRAKECVATMSDQFVRSQHESGTSSTEYEPGCSPAASLPYRAEALSLAEPDLCLLGCAYCMFLLSGLLRSPAQPVTTQEHNPESAWMVLSWRY